MGDEPEAQQKQECGGTQGGVDPKILGWSVGGVPAVLRFTSTSRQGRWQGRAGVTAPRGERWRQRSTVRPTASAVTAHNWEEGWKHDGGR